MLLSLIQNHIDRCPDCYAGQRRNILPIVIVVICTATTDIDLKSREASNHAYADIVFRDVSACLAEDTAQDRR